MGVLGFAVVTILSIAFAAALLFRPDSLSTVWASVRGLPLVVEIVVWVLFLPWMLSLWAWRTSWPLWLRLLVVAVLIVGTPFTFFPPPR